MLCSVEAGTFLIRNLPENTVQFFFFLSSGKVCNHPVWTTSFLNCVSYYWKFSRNNASKSRGNCHLIQFQCWLGLSSCDVCCALRRAHHSFLLVVHTMSNSFVINQHLGKRRILFILISFYRKEHKTSWNLWKQQLRGFPVSVVVATHKSEVFRPLVCTLGFGHQAQRDLRNWRFCLGDHV